MFRRIVASNRAQLQLKFSFTTLISRRALAPDLYLRKCILDGISTSTLKLRLQSISEFRKLKAVNFRLNRFPPDIGNGDKREIINWMFSFHETTKAGLQNNHAKLVTLWECQNLQQVTQSLETNSSSSFYLINWIANKSCWFQISTAFLMVNNQ